MIYRCLLSSIQSESKDLTCRERIEIVLIKKKFRDYQHAAPFQIHSTMNNSNQSECLHNETTCYFVDINHNCLSDEKVLDLILQYVVPTYYEWICIVLYVIVFLVGTIGNLLVIYCYSTSSKHEVRIVEHQSSPRKANLNKPRSRTVTNMFIMNLAAADLLVLVFCLPATVIQDVTKTWFFGLILCKFVNYIQVRRRGRRKSVELALMRVIYIDGSSLPFSCFCSWRSVSRWNLSRQTSVY